MGPPVHNRLNVLGGPAGDGGGLADAAWVEADDVIVRQDSRHAAGLVEPGVDIDEGDAASPGASGVEEDRSPRGGARRGQLLEGHRDGLALRVVVVQGHGHGRALEGGAGGAVGAVGPGEFLTVEGLQPLGDLRPGGPGGPGRATGALRGTIGAVAAGALRRAGTRGIRAVVQDDAGRLGALRGRTRDGCDTRGEHAAGGERTEQGEDGQA